MSFIRTKTNQGVSAAARVQGGTRFSHGQQRTKQREKNVLPQNKNKPRRKCCSIVSKMQGGIHFVQWRIWQRRIIRSQFWKSLSLVTLLSSAFQYFFTDCWYIQRWSTSCFVFWQLIRDHEPLSLSARFCLLSLWSSSIFFMFSPGFVLLFIQYSLRSKAFHDDEMNWFRKRDHSYWVQTKNAIELKWGLCREKSLGSQWNMRITTPWRFINFY